MAVWQVELRVEIKTDDELRSTRIRYETFMVNSDTEPHAELLLQQRVTKVSS